MRRGARLLAKEISSMGEDGRDARPDDRPAAARLTRIERDVTNPNALDIGDRVPGTRLLDANFHSKRPCARAGAGDCTWLRRHLAEGHRANGCAGELNDPLGNQLRGIVDGAVEHEFAYAREQ